MIWREHEDRSETSIFLTLIGDNLSNPIYSILYTHKLIKLQFQNKILYVSDYVIVVTNKQKRDKNNWFGFVYSNFNRS